MNYGKSATKRRLRKHTATVERVGNKFHLFLCNTLLIGTFVVGIVGICSGIGIMKGIIDSAPDISAIDVIPTGYSTTVLSNDGTEIATLVASGANRTYVTIDEIPTDLQHAFVAIEDARFYEHNGIDLQGIARVSVLGIKNRNFSQGASTITQQLIKNNVLTTWTSETSFAEKLQRKIQEQYLAIQLEKKVQNKQWILENYMNSINLGANTLGVQAASEKYFGKDVSELTLSECAVIAGITQNPAANNPITHPEKNAKRTLKVLNDMLEQGYISQKQYDEALDDNVYDRIAEHNSDKTNVINSYFVDALIDDVYNDLVTKLGYSQTDAYKAIYQGGLTIASTQDLKLQAICDEEVDNLANYPISPSYSFQLAFQVKKADGTFKNYSNQTMLSYYKAKNNNPDFTINYSTEEACYNAIAQYEQEVLEEGDTIVEGSESIHITLEPQVALTLMDQSTGQVKALVGGRGDKSGNRTWNRATDTCRQPGSTFKIIGCFAAALDAADMSLASTQDDAPFTIGNKTFHNYDNTYRGYTNIRTAITRSINIVTVKTLQEIGVNLGFEYAQKFGISTLCDDDRNLSLALGGLTNGVTNLELTGAYAAIANSGKYLQPKFYTTVYDHDGNVLLDISETQESRKVLKKSTAWLLTDAMKDVLTSGTGTRAYFGSSMPQAGKSGTTTSNRDCLWAGYTPYYTCVIWGGYDDNSKQNGSYTSYPKVIWKSIMSRVHADLPYKDFKMPKDVKQVSVCSASGKIAQPGICASASDSHVYTEYFASKDVPKDICSLHKVVKVCEESGMLAGPYCPEDLVKEKVVIVSDSSEGSGVTNKPCDIHDENWVPEEDESDKDDDKDKNKDKKPKPDPDEDEDDDIDDEDHIDDEPDDVIDDEPDDIIVEE